MANLYPYSKELPDRAHVDFRLKFYDDCIDLWLDLSAISTLSTPRFKIQEAMAVEACSLKDAHHAEKA